MTQKLTLASNLLLKISVLFVLQAMILLMISNYHAQPQAPTEDSVKNSIPEVQKENPKSTTKAKAQSKSKPASKK